MGETRDLMQDGLGRRFPYLRLSVTNVCNFRCVYCLPFGSEKQSESPLRLEEIAALVAGLGMRKVRLTGGEPTLRADLVDIVAAVAERADTVALSTNGYRLEQLAAPLHAAGLRRVNVSVDSLDPARFAEITGKDCLADVLRGIDRCLALGVAVKINAVLMRDLNDGLEAFLRYIEERPVTVRFIQLMRTGQNDVVFLRRHMPVDGVVAALSERGFVPRGRAGDAGPAQEFDHPSYAGSMGFIAPYSAGFCDSCNRLRVTSTGHLQTCLFGDGTVDLRDVIFDPAALRARVAHALTVKPAAHRLHENNPGTTRHLAMVGG